MAGRFGLDQGGVGAARRIWKARPNEMKDFVHCNEAQKGRFPSQLGLKDNFPEADERGGMYRSSDMRRAGEQFAAMRGEVRKNCDRNRATDESRHTGGSRPDVRARWGANVSVYLEPEEREWTKPVFGATGF